MDSRACLCLYHCSTYPKDEIEEHEQCFHAGHCGNSLQSFSHHCLLLIVFSEWQLLVAVCGHSYTGRSQPPACSRPLARCAHAPSWTLKCKCRFYVPAPHDEAFLHLTTLTNESQVVLSKRQLVVGGPLIYYKCEFGAEKEIFDRLQQILGYPGSVLFSWRQELWKGNECVPKDSSSSSSYVGVTTHYGGLAFSAIFFHSVLSLFSFLHHLIPIVWISSSSSSVHLLLGRCTQRLDFLY